MKETERVCVCVKKRQGLSGAGKAKMACSLSWTGLAERGFERVVKVVCLVRLVNVSATPRHATPLINDVGNANTLLTFAPAGRGGGGSSRARTISRRDGSEDRRRHRR